MRQLALTFLTVLMLMPSLACAMPMCKSNAQASATPPCHGATHANQENADQNTSGMLIQDCMGVDLQKSDTVSIDNPDLKTDFVVYASLTNVLTNQLAQIDSNTIRGPPLRPDFVVTDLPVYQTTQRLRL
jgi:hypothetical protein